MRPITELVDEFIEELSTGVVDSRISEYLKKEGSEVQSGETRQIGQFLANVQTYLKLTAPKDRERMAEVVFEGIIVLRTLGLITNNQSQKQVEMLRDENAKLRDEMAKKDERIKDLLSVLGAQPTEDRKVGVR